MTDLIRRSIRGNIEIKDSKLYINGNEFYLPGYYVIQQIGSGANAIVFKILVSTQWKNVCK